MNSDDYIETVEQTVDAWRIESGLQCQKVLETLWLSDFAWKVCNPPFFAYLSDTVWENPQQFTVV